MSKKKPEETESYKIKKSVLEKVQKHKEKTGMPIQRFIEDAIEEKLLYEKEYSKLRKKKKSGM